MLKLESVSKSYGRRQALDRVDLELRPGELVGLFGENGAGKTTLMKCILGYLDHRGSITLDGVPVTRKNIGRLSFATSAHSFFPHPARRGPPRILPAAFPPLPRKAL